MYELKKAIEEVLRANAEPMASNDDIEQVESAIQHLREVYSAVKDRL